MPGAIVVQEPPSPWHALLGGLGYGFSSGMDDYLQRKREKDAMIAEILQQSDPGFLATDTGQAVLQKLGIQGDPAIQQMAQQGRQQFAPTAAGGPAEMPGGSMVNIPGVAPENMPDIPLQMYDQQKEAEERAKKEAEFYEELRRKVVEKKTLGAVEQAMKPEVSPRERITLLGETIQLLQQNGMDPKGISVNIPDVGNVNILTAYQRERNRMEAAHKTTDRFMEGKEDYFSAVEDAANYKTQAAKYLSAIKAGNFEESSGILAGILANLGGGKEKTFQDKVETAKKLSPERRIKYLAPFFNETLRTKNNKIKLYAKQAGVADPDVPDLIDPSYLITLDEKLPETPPDSKEKEGGASIQQTIKLPKETSQTPSTEAMMAEARFIFDTPKGRERFKSVQEAFEWVKKGYQEEQKK